MAFQVALGKALKIAESLNNNVTEKVESSLDKKDVKLPTPGCVWANQRKRILLTICLTDVTDPVIHLGGKNLYFKTVGGVTSPASVTSNISSMTATERRAELHAELAELVRLSGSQSDSELVNLASLYYGLTETLKTEATTTNLGPAQLRDLAETEVSSALSGLSDAARAYLPWIFGSLSDQQLILIACGAQFTVPTGLMASFTASVLTESV